MPELPEVQTVVSDLNERILGDVITDFWSAWSKAIKGKTLTKFKKEIIGRKILGIRRIGKNIFIDLSEGKTLYLHLKMTGHLLIKSEIRNSKFEATPKKQNSETPNYFEDKVNQYIRHSWTLMDEKGNIKNLDFSDMRKFAKIVLENTDEINSLPEIKKLGIDAMDKNFTLKKFEEILERRINKAIGLVLMEQELIAGIGNIYRSEILFVSKVDPQRKILSLSVSEKKKFFCKSKKSLEKLLK